MVCIETIHSQLFVISQPQFDSLLQILAVEVHQLPCQCAKEDHRSFEVHPLSCSAVERAGPSLQHAGCRQEEPGPQPLHGLVPPIRTEIDFNIYFPKHQKC